MERHIWRLTDSQSIVKSLWMYCNRTLDVYYIVIAVRRQWFFQQMYYHFPFMLRSSTWEPIHIFVWQFVQ